ncbi:hypothetical protein CPB86DRAFT_693757 [Serendipita vermifera]|nr:hypothetical protein CPB86DRAFT_693757 [Serendipita vermifera]
MFNGSLVPNAPQHSQLPPLGDLHNGMSTSPASGDDAHRAAQLANALGEPSKNETRPQATFLTKLYALLERPENHHMIRWDAAGEHIIVERPEQLALHVLPSVYRQSRFASFSRQLNIYGFMRKVNLRNIDSTIDDPDASTWSHPTLRRNSPADVIANFKRRVPPRLPKPRKRPEDSALTSGAPRTAGRARGFSAPGSYTQPQPTWQSATPFGQAHARQALPPLAPLSTQSDMPLYPSGPHSSTGYMGHQPPPGNGLHHRSSHGNLLHPLTPATPDDPHSPHHHLTPGGYPTHPQGYGQSGRDTGSMFLGGGHGSSQGTGYGYNPDGGAPHSNWSFLPPLQTGNTTAQGNNASVSPDSRPTTGYSVASSSMSIPYEDMSNDYRPRSSAGGRPMTPTAMNSGRPPSAHSRPSSAIAGTGPQPPSHLRIGRARRHSQAVSPYPAPFYDINDGRPVTAPDNTSVHRVRSFGNLPQVDSIGEETGPQGGSGVGGHQAPFMGFNGTHADFAYNAGGGANPGSLESMDGGWLNGSTGASHAPSLNPPPPSGTASSMQGRPNTAASTMSAHSSASATQTPPVMDTSFTGHDTDINRCE